ncbi:MAG: hypothetical protein JW754_05535 [Candidatus Aenigmarchaeota archaeon]|nr:hypothetical protein [Candidatus Aenigmarchaeota archaeon]
MRKGITPIVSIIILLLITIGLAASAYTFLSGFLGGYTRGSVMIVDSYCQGMTTTTIKLRNAGTEEMSLGDCNSVFSGADKDCGSLTVSRTDGQPMSNAKFSGASIKPQQLTTFTDTCASGTESRTCTYRIVGSGLGAITATVNCG